MNYDAMLDAHLSGDCWPGCRACDDPMDPDLPSRTTQELRRSFEDDGPRRWRNRVLLLLIIVAAVAWVVFVAMDLARAAGA